MIEIVKQTRVMEAETILKNGARPVKPQEHEQIFISCARHELGIKI